MKAIQVAIVPILILNVCLPSLGLVAADNASDEKPTKPYSIGFLPYGRYTDDQGFGFGIVFQWDDKRSVDYKPYYYSHRVSFERTTRGIQDYIYRFDSKYLLPAGLRLTFEARYQTSLFEPYHGPGGAQTSYDNRFSAFDSKKDKPEYPDYYRGKFYYMYDKRYLQVNTLVQGWIKEEQGLRWLAGLLLLNTKVDTITYSDYIEGDPDPGEQSLLAHHWHQLAQDTAGGAENGLIAGLVWDRRDHETSPHKGFWSEVLVRWVPGMFGNDFSYAAVTATHRHYIPLSGALMLACRVSGRFMSEGAPFFSISRLDGSFTTETGLGGNKTIRGVLWQRAAGRQFFYGNLELRYRLLPLFRTGYFAVSGFYDVGRTFDQEPSNALYDPGDATDRLHQGIGFGQRLAPNDTFILALDLGFPLDGDLDGPGLKIYMGLDWLF